MRHRLRKKTRRLEAAAVALAEKIAWLIRVRSEYLRVWYELLQAVIDRLGVPLKPMKPQRKRSTAKAAEADSDRRLKMKRRVIAQEDFYS